LPRGVRSERRWRLIILPQQRRASVMGRRARWG
jgi:hypothetical protein